MNVHRYETIGGKDLIMEYILELPKNEQAMAFTIIGKLEKYGVEALELFNTRKLRKKLCEIKFNKNRIMYVLIDEDNIYLLHACRKQKQKAEQFELSKAISRVKELEIELNKKDLI